MKYLLNRIQTPDGTVLTSRHRHNFVEYTDKNGQYYANDGGRDYLRRLADKPDYKDLSVKDDGKFETRRQYLEWGQNFDKNNKRLLKTKFISIKDLATDHIFAILKNVWKISLIYRDTFNKELDYRNEGWAE